MSHFDLDNARRDVLDAGGDPDYLEGNAYHRDKYMQKMGLRPEKYGGKSPSEYSRGKTSAKKSSTHKSSSGWSKDPDSLEGCFLTTACVRARNLPDDCEELTVLRSFRDTWLKAQPGGEEDVDEYYAFAPKVVKAIDSLADADERWNALYESLVLPAVAYIKSGENEKAYALYKSKALELKKQYCAPSKAHRGFGVANNANVCVYGPPPFLDQRGKK